MVIDKHQAAVKAVVWSHLKEGQLATGGGSQDKKICIWNVKTQSLISEVETDS